MTKQNSLLFLTAEKTLAKHLKDTTVALIALLYLQQTILAPLAAIISLYECYLLMRAMKVTYDLPNINQHNP